MATVTVNPTNQNDTTTTKGGLYSTETFDKAYGYPLGEDGKRKDPVIMDPEEAEKASDKSAFEGSAIKVRVDYPATFQGLLDLANRPTKDDEGNIRDQKDVQAEIVRVFNSGAKIKVNNDLRAQLTKVDEKGELVFNEATDLTDDGFLDMTSSITRGSRRVFLTEEQKTWKNLSNLPKELRITMFHAYLTATNKPLYTPED